MRFVELKTWLVSGAIVLTTLASVGEAEASSIQIVSTPPGAGPLKGIMICSQVGLDKDWCTDADFKAAAARMGVATAKLVDGNEFGAYEGRCSGGEFKQLLDAIAATGMSSGHPELANAPIIGMGHSHGGDYWNYFNACYPDRMALVFCKSSGGVTLTGEALKTPAVWEVGTNDLRSDCCNHAFRAQTMAYRAKGTPMSLVLGPGESHTQLTPGPRAMVIALIEGIFKLRVAPDADFRKPTALNQIDESTGCYWLGDDSTKDASPYASSPDKGALYKTSFLPTADIAQMWKTTGAKLPADIVVENGTCANCYAAPAGEPPAVDGPKASCGSDGGVDGSVGVGGAAGAGGSANDAGGNSEDGGAGRDAGEAAGGAAGGSVSSATGMGGGGGSAGAGGEGGSGGDAGRAGAGGSAGGGAGGDRGGMTNGAAMNGTGGAGCSCRLRGGDDSVPRRFSAAGWIALALCVSRIARRARS